MARLESEREAKRLQPNEWDLKIHYYGKGDWETVAHGPDLKFDLKMTDGDKVRVIDKEAYEKIFTADLIAMQDRVTVLVEGLRDLIDNAGTENGCSAGCAGSAYQTLLDAGFK